MLYLTEDNFAFLYLDLYNNFKIIAMKSVFEKTHKKKKNKSNDNTN